MKFLLCIILVFFIFGCTYEVQEFEIKLEKVADAAESVEEYHGMSNIFFETDYLNIHEHYFKIIVLYYVEGHV